MIDSPTEKLMAKFVIKVAKRIFYLLPFPSHSVVAFNLLGAVWSILHVWSILLRWIGYYDN